jgi:hypothetical protein
MKKRLLQRTFGAVLCIVFSIRMFAGGASHFVNSNERPTDDTLIKFRCTCGNLVDTSSIVSVPIFYEGKLYHKTYFNFTPFYRQYYDYIALFGDTVFIIRGGSAPLDKNSIDHRQVLCILKGERHTYERKKIVELPIGSCLIFKEIKFDHASNSNLFTFDVKSCGHSSTSDLPYIKQITFNDKGGIVAFVFDRVDCVWDCRRIQIKH